MKKQTYELTAPCHFGLEAVLKREIGKLGCTVTKVSDGRVSFSGEDASLEGSVRTAARANVELRSAERVMLSCAVFEATTFDMLFEAVKAVPWEQWIPKDGRFWVRKVSSVKSRLFSPTDIQSIVKKAMVARLSSVYGIEWFPETGAAYPLRISILKDEVSVCLDTSGDSLHKRGYRVSPVIAPLSETLAAGLLGLTPFGRGRTLADPCCGSGTIPIEAAMAAAHIAPGLKRHFLMESWKNLHGAEAVAAAKEEAAAAVLTDTDCDIQGFDKDPRAVKFARDNAEAAGVAQFIHFQQRELSEFSHSRKYGFLIANPPYGERLEEKEALTELYRTFGTVYEKLPDWSMYILTSCEDAEQMIGRKADKNRKIYNGMIETRFYQYLGPKPPKRG